MDSGSAVDKPTYCRGCGYNLALLPADRCPECGRGFDRSRPWSVDRHPRSRLVRRIVRTLSIVVGAPAFCLLLLWIWMYAGAASEARALASLGGRSYKPDRVSLLPAPVSRRFGSHARVAERTERVDLAVEAQPLHDLRSLPYLRRLTLRLMNEFEESPRIEQVAGLRHVEELFILGGAADRPQSNLTNRGMSRLRGLTGLRELSLHFTSVTVLDPDVLRDMPRLERISLCGMATTDETLSALKHVPRLKWLRVSKAHVGDGGLVHVAALRDLELLDLEDTAVTEDGLRHLRGLNRLKWLNLSFVPTERAVPHLRALPNLRNLNIHKFGGGPDVEHPRGDIGQLRRALPRVKVNGSQFDTTPGTWPSDR